MSDPVASVRTFLSLLEARRAAEAVELLAPDVEWRNTGLPTVRGARVGAILRGLERRRIAFRADLRHIAADGDVVLSERTDFLRIGRWESTFRVCGTFRVREGRIELWDDHYSVGDVLAGSARGLIDLVRGR